MNHPTSNPAGSSPEEKGRAAREIARAMLKEEHEKKRDEGLEQAEKEALFAFQQMDPRRKYHMASLPGIIHQCGDTVRNFSVRKCLAEERVAQAQTEKDREKAAESLRQAENCLEIAKWSLGQLREML